jgi:uncharacterized damage-inducible protein DinB
MTFRTSAMLAALLIAPSLAAAQGSPVADAFRANEAEMAKNLVGAAETMPAAKYGYKPTAAQMTFGAVAAHLAQGNDLFCGAIGGVKAPTRSKIAPTDSKDVLVARLKETFAFCDQALAKLDDSKLGEEIPMFGRTMTRAAVIIMTAGDWEDHYSQWANYLRLNGLLPPTAKKGGM